MPHFPRVPTRVVGQVTFNTLRYEFVNSPDNAIDLTYVIYHENHNKCCSFTGTGELKSEPLSIFPFSTKFVTCKGRHLHIPKPSLEVSKNESLYSGRDIPNIRYANEIKDKGHSKQSDVNRQEYTILDSSGQNAEEDNDNLGLTFLTAKTIDEFEERLVQLHKLYVRETKRFLRQLELSQTREEVQQSIQSVFIPVRSQGKCCPMIQSEQDNQQQNPSQDLDRFLPESRGKQSRQSEQYPIPRHECPSQRTRDQVEMDAQITPILQAEDQTKEQCQNSQRDRQVSHSIQAPHRQNGQYLQIGKV